MPIPRWCCSVSQAWPRDVRSRTTRRHAQRDVRHNATSGTTRRQAQRDVRHNATSGTTRRQAQRDVRHNATSGTTRRQAQRDVRHNATSGTTRHHPGRGQLATVRGSPAGPFRLNTVLGWSGPEYRGLCRSPMAADNAVGLNCQPETAYADRDDYLVSIGSGLSASQYHRTAGYSPSPDRRAAEESAAASRPSHGVRSMPGQGKGRRFPAGRERSAEIPRHAPEQHSQETETRRGVGRRAAVPAALPRPTPARAPPGRDEARPEPSTRTAQHPNGPAPEAPERPSTRTAQHPKHPNGPAPEAPEAPEAPGHPKHLKSPEAPEAPGHPKHLVTRSTRKHPKHLVTPSTQPPKRPAGINPMENSSVFGCGGPGCHWLMVDGWMIVNI